MSILDTLLGLLADPLSVLVSIAIVVLVWSLFRDWRGSHRSRALRREVRRADHLVPYRQNHRITGPNSHRA